MPKKILTIDDDPYIVKYITEVLSDNGYATCSASSVEEALSVLEAERPDLVTLDMEMPDEWGPRFYRKMSMNPAFKDTPVIVISGLQGIHLSPSATPWLPSEALRSRAALHRQPGGVGQGRRPQGHGRGITVSVPAVPCGPPETGVDDA